jgi:hypothetical protein
MPYNNGVEAGNVGSQQNQFPINRRACADTLCEMSRGWKICRHSDGVLYLSCNELQYIDESESLDCKISNGLRPVPHNVRLEAIDIQPYAIFPNSGWNEAQSGAMDTLQ